MTTTVERAPAATSILARPHLLVTTGILVVITSLAFEYMAIGTAMPVISRELDGWSLYAWGFSAPLIASLVANVVAGVWADAKGPEQPLLAGLVISVAGMVVAGLAPSMGWFVAGRLIQGGGAMIVPIYLIIARAYPDELRPKVFAATSAAWVLPSIAGPALAGVVAEHLDWRLIFLGMIPITVPGALILLPVARRSRTDPAAEPAGRKRNQVLAAIAMAGGAGAFLYSIGHPQWSGAFAWTALLGLAGLAIGLPRLLPPGTLRLGRGLPSVIGLRGLLSGAALGAEAFIPLALTSLHGVSASTAGLVLTAGALGWSAGAWYQGRFNGSPVRLTIVGASLVTFGVVGSMTTVTDLAWLSLPAWIVFGIGMGFAYSSTSVLMLNLSPQADQGRNSAALQIGDTLGGALVVGAAGAIVHAFGSDRLTTGLTVSGLLTTSIAVVAIVAAVRVMGGRSGRE